MSKTENQVRNMVQGADWSAKLIAAMVESIEQVETNDGKGDLADLHHLATPDGHELLRVLMRQTVNARFIRLGLPVEVNLDLETAMHEMRHSIEFDDDDTTKLFRRAMRRERVVYKRWAHLGITTRSVRELRVTRHNVEFPVQTLRARFAGAHELLLYVIEHLKNPTGISLATYIEDEALMIEPDSHGRFCIRPMPVGWLDSSVIWLVEL